MPVGLVKSDMPNSVRAERLTSAKRTLSSTWLLAGPSRTCSSVTTSSRFSTKPRATLMARSTTSLLATDPESTTLRPLPRTSMRSFGNSCFTCSLSRVRSRCTDTSKRRTAPPRLHTNIEMAPGPLPCTSSWFGAVTSASAMSALVSDTRAIGLPTSMRVERPTSSRTASGADASTSTPGVAAGAAAAAGLRAADAVVATGCTCA